MNISIRSVPNEEIKLRHGFTGADWWFDGWGHLEVRVALELTDWRERACLIVHEVTEAIMCQHLGITVAQVDDYDAKWEAEHPGDSSTDVGDIDDCPYRVPHNYATAIERILAGVLGVSWREYDDRLGKI